MKCLIVIIGIAVLSMIIVPVFADSYPEKIADSLTDYYNLRGDAYAEIQHSYMAFLSYDKANRQTEKDRHYNNWAKYKSYLENKEKEIEKYGVGNFQEIINRSYEIGDYHTTLKYSEMAAKENPDSWIAYQQKYRALLFLGMQNEALVTFEKLAETGHFDIGSSAHKSGLITLLYATGDYKGALEVFEKHREYSLSVGGPGLPPGSATMLAMVYEKLGNSHSADYWYDFDSNDGYFKPECLKAGYLSWMGFHDEVVELMESDNNIDKCPGSLKFPYIISKDIVTGAYRPPIEHVFASQEESSEQVSTSLEPDPEPEVDFEVDNGGCLIATATYGSELAPQVQQLRELRDNTLLQTESGSAFMTGFNQLYYSFSPTIADWERQNVIFKEAVKLTITPLLTSLSILNYVDMESEAEVLGYGIGVILLNIGMYFVAPTIIIQKLFSRKDR